MPNHLVGQMSPYLVQHQNNPVDWYPWGEEAFRRARAEDKPVFLSIGYSTCHWCHVMARESFEDDRIADILNAHFVSIKVDREERPDIDSVYMAVCQELTGSGGWPMSIFMTAEKKPFFAGTYYPPQRQFGRPGFDELLLKIETMWRTERARLLRSAELLASDIGRERAAVSAEGQDPVGEAAQSLARSFDPVCGGFGNAPKFPTPHNLLFLLYYAAVSGRDAYREMVETRLLQMRRGGIYDQIGFGFSRYSTDRFFLAPHFEKMLYDNALLMIAYTAAYRAAKQTVFLRTAEETAEFILREMTAPEGGFYSAQDADSAGEEGKYYTFTPDEARDVLGDAAGTRFNEMLDITEKGNFHGVNIPNRLKSGELNGPEEAWLTKMRLYRADRMKLSTDDKVLTARNGMTVAAFCMLFRVTGNTRYLNAAERAQKYIEKYLREGDVIFAARRGDKRGEKGFLDDYAWYAAALTELYLSTLEREYLTMAERVFNTACGLFADARGGFFQRPARDNELFVNPKEDHDGAIPGGNSVMAYAAVRLAQLTDDEIIARVAAAQTDYLSSRADHPAGQCFFLLTKLIFEHPPVRIRIVKKDDQPLPAEATRQFLANVTAAPPSEEYPLLNDAVTYYVCRGNICLPPGNAVQWETV
ncbi:MAG: thioredoxin domain-containing protein [Oscillospiraceae bacterium]|nr:thioredoxin domain-containing protein [Oscillospiraceae bacterium]